MFELVTIMSCRYPRALIAHALRALTHLRIPFDADEFERGSLIRKTQAAQELGVDCYVTSPNGELSIQVSPTDSPVLVLDSLRAEGTMSFAAVSFNYDRPTAAKQAIAAELHLP